MCSRRSEERVTDRFDRQVIEIEESGSRLEEHNILALRAGKRHTHQFPVPQSVRIILHIRECGQIGVGISECIQDPERAEVLRIRQSTHYDGLAICRSKESRIGDLSAAGRRAVCIIVIGEASSVELNHHRVEPAVELRQDEIGVEGSIRCMYTECIAVITSHLQMSVGSSIVSRHRALRLISLPLDEPLITVDRSIISCPYREASRLVIERVSRFAGNHVVLLPLGRIIEVPDEGMLCVGFERQAERAEGEFVGSDIVISRSRTVDRLKTSDIIRLRIEVLYQLRGSGQIQILVDSRTRCSSNIQVPRSADAVPFHQRRLTIRRHFLQRNKAESLSSIQGDIIEEDVRRIRRLFRQEEYQLAGSHRSRIQIQRIVAEELVVLRRSLGVRTEFVQMDSSHRFIGLKALVFLDRTYLELSREGRFRESGIPVNISRTHFELKGSVVRFSESREDNISAICLSGSVQHQGSRSIAGNEEALGILAAMRIV